MLVDTDVIIWFLRGNPNASSLLKRLPNIFLSAVSVMEIIQGILNAEEMRLWKSFLKEYKIKQLMIDESVSTKAIYWMEEFVLSHKLKMADALIAATADINGLELLTGNSRDYKFLPGIRIKVFHP